MSNATSDKPLVSVIVPTFNRASRLPACVATVLAQSWRPIQLILVDDGSSDNTPAVMESLKEEAEQAGVTPTFLRIENSGCAAARNEGLKKIEGDYFAFLDDDDAWFPDKLDRQMQALADSNADACCCLVRRETGKDEVRTDPRSAERLLSGTEPGRALRYETSAHLISLVVRTELLSTVGDFETSLKTGSDTEWMLRLIHVANFCNVPEILGRYAHSEDALTRHRGIEQLFARDERDMRSLDLVKQRNAQRDNWDAAAWQ